MSSENPIYYGRDGRPLAHQPRESDEKVLRRRMRANAVRNTIILLLLIAGILLASCSPNPSIGVRAPACTGREEAEINCTERTDPPIGSDYIHREWEFRGDRR